MAIEHEPDVAARPAALRHVDPGATAIAVPAPIGATADLIAAWDGRPIAAWQGRDGDVVVGLDALAVVGGGSFDDVAARGAAILSRVRTASIAGLAASSRDLVGLGIQPRLIGGFAFARGAADRGGWRALGDAWWC